MAVTEVIGSREGGEPKHASAVADLLADSDPKVRTAALRSLGMMPRSAGPHVGTMVALLSDSNWIVRVGAAHALEELGEHIPDIVAPHASEGGRGEGSLW